MTDNNNSNSDAKLTEYLANAGVMHIRAGFQDGSAFLARPHHERVHRSLDMLLLLLVVLLEMLLG